MNEFEGITTIDLKSEFNLPIQSFEKQSLNDYQLMIDNVDSGGFIGTQIPIQVEYLYWQDISIVVPNLSIRIECKTVNQYRGHKFAYADILNARYMIEDVFILFAKGRGYENDKAKNEIQDVIDSLNITGYMVTSFDELLSVIHSKTLIKNILG